MEVPYIMCARTSLKFRSLKLQIIGRSLKLQGGPLNYREVPRSLKLQGGPINYREDSCG